jgi:NAD(P)-dependent dehydrogenase (short-subunit alcohol dehydrogenase family)
MSKAKRAAAPAATRKKRSATGGGRSRAKTKSDDPSRRYPDTQGGFERQSQRWPGATERMEPRPDHGEESYAGSGRLAGKAALITGGDSGIGRAIAIAFAREGADVAITYLDQREEDDARTTMAWVEKAGRAGEAIAADLRGPAACRRVVQRAVEAFGRLDILVNNAAFQREQERLEAIDEDQLRRTFETNVFAYLWMAQAAADHLPRGGVILNTGSVTALDGSPTLIDYSASKGAVHVLTKSLAKAFGERGIRVDCVAPGPVWTPLIPATLDRDHVERFGADTVWGRAAQPAEIAPSYVFLASREGSFYTGDILAPTGRSTTR